MTALASHNRTNIPAGRIAVWIVGLVGLILSVSSWQGLTATANGFGVLSAVRGVNTNLALIAE